MTLLNIIPAASPSEGGWFSPIMLWELWVISSSSSRRSRRRSSSSGSPWPWPQSSVPAQQLCPAALHRHTGRFVPSRVVGEQNCLRVCVCVCVSTFSFISIKVNGLQASSSGSGPLLGVAHTANQDVWKNFEMRCPKPRAHTHTHTHPLCLSLQNRLFFFLKHSFFSLSPVKRGKARFAFFRRPPAATTTTTTKHRQMRSPHGVQEGKRRVITAHTQETTTKERQKARAGAWFSLAGEMTPLGDD